MIENINSSSNDDNKILFLLPNYQLVTQLGEGSYGQVYQCIDKRKTSQNGENQEECKLAIKKIILQDPANDWNEVIYPFVVLSHFRHKAYKLQSRFSEKSKFLTILDMKT